MLHLIHEQHKFKTASHCEVCHQFCISKPQDGGGGGAVLRVCVLGGGAGETELCKQTLSFRS